jgi:hypothetical protein
MRLPLLIVGFVDRRKNSLSPAHCPSGLLGFVVAAAVAAAKAAAANAAGAAHADRKFSHYVLLIAAVAVCFAAVGSDVAVVAFGSGAGKKQKKQKTLTSNKELLVLLFR